MSTLHRPSNRLQGKSAQRAIEMCLLAFERGDVTPRHIKNVLNCDDVDVSKFEKYLEHPNSHIRISVCEIISHKGNVDLIIEAIGKESEGFVICKMLDKIKKVKYKNVEDLLFLIRSDDTIIAEEVFKTFVAVGRADLLFPLAMSDDKKTTERVRRYLNEQGWLE
jgi:hypothetical protein